MGLFDAALIDAVETTRAQAGDPLSFGDKLGASTAGAVISGLGSIYNTFAAGANLLGADAEMIDTAKKLEDIDRNWAQYYQQNANAIDAAGFIGGSLIPGTIAVKGLNMLRAGGTATAMGRALGFARTKQAESLSAAIAELATEGGTVFTQINRNKVAAMGWGFADQVLTAAAFETGVALTMKQSPLLADDSWWDVAKSGFTGALLGGVIGGGIDSILLNKSYKDLWKAAEARGRIYDYQAVFSKMNLMKGDEAYGIADSLLSLPKEVAEMAGFVKIPEFIAERSGKSFADFGRLFENKLQATEKSALSDFEKALRELSTDGSTAGSFATYVLKKFSDLKLADTAPPQIRESLGDLLFELKKVRPATSPALYKNEELFYFKKKLTPEEVSKISKLEDWEAAVVSKTPFEENAYKQPYVFTGTPEQLANVKNNIALIGREGDNGFPTLSAAWKEGRDMALMPDGTFRVNDASSLWRRVNDPTYNPSRFFNVRTGAMTENTVLTAADRVEAGQALAISPHGVGINGRFINMKEFRYDGDAEYYTARHAWASRLADKDIPDIVDGKDISLLERLKIATEETRQRVTIIDDIGGEIEASEISIADYLTGAKVNRASQMYEEAAELGRSLDLREVAYTANLDPKVLEDLIGKEFIYQGKDKAVAETINAIPIESYLQRENLLLEFARPQQFKELDTISEKMSWRDKRLVIMDQVAMTGGQFVTGELAWRYRVMQAVQAAKNAFNAVQGAERASQLMDLAQDGAKLADSLGVGANFLSSSNASYGEVLKLWSQDTGKKVHLWIQEDVNKVMDRLNASVQQMRQDPKAAAELGIVTERIRGDDVKYVWHPTDAKMLIPKEIADLYPNKIDDFNAMLAATTNKLKINSDEVVAFLKLHQELNAERVEKRGVLYAARGTKTNMDGTIMYVPPVDTTYFKHFAFVKDKEGMAFGTSETQMVFGRDAAELSKRISLIDRTKFDVITKDQTEQFFKAKGTYDFDLTINSPRINSELRKTGALSNVMPEVRPENLMEDYIRWHQNQAARLVRDSVETYYGQQVEELRKLGESFTQVATSRFAGTTRASKSEVYNPFDDYVKTALDISKRSEYTFFHQANEFVDALGTRAYQAARSLMGDADKGIISYQEANRMMEQYGMRGMYESKDAFFTANVPRDRNLAKEYIAKANTLLANFVLRFDFANSLINIVSTPLMLGTEMASIRNLAKSDPQLIGKLAELTSTKVPGQDLLVPSNSKLIFKAVENFFGPEKLQLIERYKANGDIKDVLSQYHSMMDSLALRPDFKVFSEGVNKAFEKAATLTGNNWSEQFTRFVSADVMRQVTDPLVEAGKMSLKEQNAYISVFVNRVQGNYISSQRPILFQGVLGSAIGLFQTYSFNLLQQLLRHVENKDTKTLATLFGMQAGLFGLNGTPLFEAVNTHIIGNAAVNKGHHDAYSVVPSLIGKEMGDWLLYGTASAFPAFGNSWPALYSRGDISPRHISIVPVTPGDVPAFDASIRLVNNIVDVGSKLIHGANIGPTLLQGLEHNGINRPLAGMAQILAGQTTTSKGSLISASSDFDLIATASRILGAKPMDEAVALNNMYRMKAYQAADTDRMAFLGEVVKSHLSRNRIPPEDAIDGFMKDYAAAGGRLENFNSSLQRWMRDANRSTVEGMRAKLQSSYGQRLSEIMGGEPLEDWRTTPSEEVQKPQ